MRTGRISAGGIGADGIGTSGMVPRGTGSSGFVSGGIAWRRRRAARGGAAERIGVRQGGHEASRGHGSGDQAGSACKPGAATRVSMGRHGSASLPSRLTLHSHTAYFVLHTVRWALRTTRSPLREAHCSAHAAAGPAVGAAAPPAPRVTGRERNVARRRRSEQWRFTRSDQCATVRPGGQRPPELRRGMSQLPPEACAGAR